MKRKTMIDRRFGFPVLLVDVPVRTLRGHQIVDINANVLQDTVLAMLVKKRGPLTGAEVRFIRLALEMTLANFGQLVGVSHAAVIKWEAQGEEPTKMGYGTEFHLQALERQGPCPVHRRSFAPVSAAMNRMARR